MQPIVNGLQEKYGEQVDFLYLNAEDGAEGQAAFDFYKIRGHPTLMLIQPDGAIAWSRIGATTREELEQAIGQILSQ